MYLAVYLTAAADVKIHRVENVSPGIGGKSFDIVSEVR